MEIKEIVKREQIKYETLYKEDKEYGVRESKPITNIRGNKKVRKVFNKILGKSKKVLDIGCGRCYYAKFFNERHPDLEITGIDIAGKEILKDYPDLKIIPAPSHKIPFKDSSFDLVMHLDGMEHIPIELEQKTLSEQYRVSSKWIYHQISTNTVSADKYWIDKGLGALHINIKSKKEWETLFNRYVKKFRLKRVFFIEYKSWIHILLEKK